MINGNKTYIAATLLALFGVAGFLTGKLDGSETVVVILEAAAIVGLRHGIAKA